MRRLLDIQEVSELVGVPVTTLRLQRRRREQIGGLAIKIGKHLRWRPEDIEAWLNEQTARG